MEDRHHKSSSEDLEIDVFDLLAGKMNNTAMEHLHRRICGK